MSKKLDNWALGLGIAGLILSLFQSGLYSKMVTESYPWWIFSIFMYLLIIVLFSGAIIGIMALTKGSKQKWKPILAIISPFLVGLIQVINFISKMTAAGF